MLDFNNIIGEDYVDENGNTFVLLQELGIGTGYYFAIQKSEYINPSYIVLIKK